MTLVALFRSLLTRRKLQFAAIGLTATAVSYGSLFLLVHAWHISAIAAYVVQAVLAIEVNFLLNSKVTWGDRQVSLWQKWWRFHATRVVMVPLNQILFTGLVLAHVHYLLANTICIATALVINYMLGDRFIFTTQAAEHPRHQGLPDAESYGETARMLRRQTRTSWCPRVSVVVPVKNSQATIKPLVQSLLDQDYAGGVEVILVGDINDTTWSVLRTELAQGVVTAYETAVHAPQRDANAKRNIGLEHATGDVLALTDSDMQLPTTWVSTLVDMLREYDAVAGSMVSTTDDFWGRYVDQNAWGSKTPRMNHGYPLTSANFGRGRYKPPVTANFACTRQVYDLVGGPPIDFSYSYEDYPWFRAIVDAGYSIRCDQRLAAYHSHRTGLKALVREYRRSGWGCADYLVLYPWCPLARKRLIQLAGLVVAGALAMAGVVWSPWVVLAVAAGAAGAVSLASAVRSRWVGALAYPFCTVVLGAAFAQGMLTRLARQGRQAPRPVTVNIVRALSVTMAAGETR